MWQRRDSDRALACAGYLGQGPRPEGGRGYRCALWSLLRTIFVCAILASNARAADQGPLGIADLAAYQAALSGRSEHGETPVAVTFDALWKTPEKYQGHRVEIAGTIVRRFRQGAYGVFPPLEEVWVASPSGNPLCLVCPSGAPAPCRLGDTVRFTGTYLKRVQYQGGDVPRLAPLIVGEGPPVVLKAAPVSSNQAAGGLSVVDWTVGLVVTALVVLVLGRQHLRRPARPCLDVEVPAPVPEFVRPGFEENGRAV